jgi:ABC-2 type transport system ATP-binding protein
MEAVVFHDVSCKIGQKLILEHITLSIQRGSITGILGPNGAGKTTLLSLINGLRNHTYGSISVLGKRFPVKEAAFRANIGVVLQETALYEELTINENLEFAAALYNVTNPKKRISEVLDLLMLRDRSDQIVSTLSNGLRRRIAIARALIHDPQLLIIDEPTLGVDVEARHAIWSHLRLLRSKGRTVVVATNYLDEIQALCDTVAVLKNGILLACASPADLIEKTGSCLDIDCDEHASKAITKVLHSLDGVLRIDKTLSGISLFLKQKSLEKQIMDRIMKQVHIEGFRLRSPDLAEVFKALEQKV